jgi:hypothetical protein
MRNLIFVHTLATFALLRLRVRLLLVVFILLKMRSVASQEEQDLSPRR